jgi:hypothetical protein
MVKGGAESSQRLLSMVMLLVTVGSIVSRL